jgi:excisionase family DNA binding protein
MVKTRIKRATSFLTSEEVVERLLAHPNLRELTAACVLPAIRVGSDWLFRSADLDSWIARQSDSTTAPTAGA